MVKVTKVFWNSLLTFLSMVFERGVSPRFLLLNVTSRCNSRCIMCNIWKKERGDDLSSEDYINIFKNNKYFFRNLEEISLMGGEPFLNPGLVEILCNTIEQCENLTAITIPTNGFLTNTILKQTEEIMKCTGNKITINIGVSIDGIGATHDKIRGVEGSFDKAIKTLNQLKQLSVQYSNLSVGFGSVVMSENLNELEKLKKLAEEMGVKYSFNPIVLTDNLYNNMEKSTLKPFNESEMDNILYYFKNFDPNGGGFRNYCISEMLSSEKRPMRCPWGYSFMYIDSNGDAYPCHYLPKEYLLGNLKSTSIEEIWFSSRANEARKKLKKEPYCKTCTSTCGFFENIKVDIGSYLIYRLKSVFVPKT